MKKNGFIKRSAAMLLAAVLAFAALSSCGSAKESSAAAAKAEESTPAVENTTVSDTNTPSVTREASEAAEASDKDQEAETDVLPETEEVSEEESSLTEVSVEGITYPYIKDFGNAEGRTEDEVTLYFVEGGDIPYVALSEYLELYCEACENRGKEGIEYESYKMNGENEYYVYRTDNKSSMTVNTKDDTLFFDDFNLFTHKPGVKALVTVMDLSEPEEMDVTEYMQRLAAATTPEEMQEIQEEYKRATQGEESTLFKTNQGVFNRSGDPVMLDLSEYLIEIVESDGECYIPLQTMSDLFMTELYMKYIFNGEKLIGAAYGSDITGEKYEAGPSTMSLEYAAFNYNELRFLLDCYYGLADEHNIDSFGSLLSQYSGLYAGLSSRDPEEFDNALKKLLFTYFDDGHSGFAASSWGSAEDQRLVAFTNTSYYGPSSKDMMLSFNRFKQARNAAFPDGVPAYQEIGDTAFVTFDSFIESADDLSDYYSVQDDTDYSQYMIKAAVPGSEDNNVLDTIRLVIYAHKMITREGSPIKNVVVDLSNNGGGNANAALFIISWMAGKADIAVEDAFTGAETLASFHADVNLDNIYSYQGLEDVTTDSLQQSGVNVYCLTSAASFSCGNLVPAACRMSHTVTLVGQQSGGGACCVLPCTTASGAEFQISGPKQLALVRNGSYYNIDQGIQPDIVLTKVESFYDREALVEYLNSLK